jgi:hypothetical protein
MHVYQLCPRRDKRGVDLISMLPSCRLLYGEPNAIGDATSYAKFFSRSHPTLIRVCDATRQRDRDARARGGFEHRWRFLFADSWV